MKYDEYGLPDLPVSESGRGWSVNINWGLFVSLPPYDVTSYYKWLTDCENKGYAHRYHPSELYDPFDYVLLWHKEDVNVGVAVKA